MIATGWVNKTKSGMAQFNQLCSWLIATEFLKHLAPIWRGEECPAKKDLSDALKWLISDVGTKERRSRGNGMREFRARHGNTDEPPEEGASSQSQGQSRVPLEQSRSIITVTVVDPDFYGGHHPSVAPEYFWDDEGNEPNFAGIMTEPTFNELCRVILKHTPAGRVIRSIQGAMEDAPEGQAPRSVQITDSEEVECWLQDTKTRPHRILAILHRAGMDGIDGLETPPARRSFPHIQEEDYTLVDLPAEDTEFDPNVRVTTTGRRIQLPRSDIGFQKVLHELIVRRDRQQGGIDHLTPVYLRKFPLGVGPDDPDFLVGKI